MHSNAYPCDSCSVSPRYADRYGSFSMGETTPPPDDRFPKVFSMTSAAYQPAGARGGFACKQQQTAEAEAAEDKEKEGRRNETGDGGATADAEDDAGTTEGASVKEEAVINEAAAEENGGAENEQGTCKAIAHRPFRTFQSIFSRCKKRSLGCVTSPGSRNHGFEFVPGYILIVAVRWPLHSREQGKKSKKKVGMKKSSGIKKGRSAIEEAVRQKQLKKQAAAAAAAAAAEAKAASASTGGREGGNEAAASSTNTPTGSWNR